jgi:hypothetical protein
MLFRETVALAAVKMMRANRGRFTTAVVILRGNSGAAGSSLGSSLGLVQRSLRLTACWVTVRTARTGLSPRLCWTSLLGSRSRLSASLTAIPGPSLIRPAFRAIRWVLGSHLHPCAQCSVRVRSDSARPVAPPGSTRLHHPRPPRFARPWIVSCRQFARLGHRPQVSAVRPCPHVYMRCRRSRPRGRAGDVLGSTRRKTPASRAPPARSRGSRHRLPAFRPHRA